MRQRKGYGKVSDVVAIVYGLVVGSVALVASLGAVWALRQEFHISLLWYPLSLLPFVIVMNSLVVYFLGKSPGQGFRFFVSTNTILLTTMALGLMGFAIYAWAMRLDFPMRLKAANLTGGTLILFLAIQLHRYYMSYLK